MFTNQRVIHFDGVLENCPERRSLYGRDMIGIFLPNKNGNVDPKYILGLWQSLWQWLKMFDSPNSGYFHTIIKLLDDHPRLFIQHMKSKKICMVCRVWMDSDPNILQIDGCQMDGFWSYKPQQWPHQIRLTSFRGAVGPVGDILSLEKNRDRSEFWKRQVMGLSQ